MHLLITKREEYKDYFGSLKIDIKEKKIVNLGKVDFEEAVILFTDYFCEKIIGIPYEDCWKCGYSIKEGGCIKLIAPPNKGQGQIEIWYVIEFINDDYFLDLSRKSKKIKTDDDIKRNNKFRLTKMNDETFIDL